MKTNLENQIDEKVIAELNLKLREEFLLGVQKFTNNPLHQTLRKDLPVQEKLKFVPRMLFFVLGFKDIMQLVRYEGNPEGLEGSVNTHSDEDSNHWEWYLRDLTFMTGYFDQLKGADLITNIWDNETLEVRKTIYLFNRYVHQYTHPVARMLMIEVLELTFDKFKAAIHPVLKNADLYSQLEYFGKRHQDTEENHTTGISEDEIAHLVDLLPDQYKQEMIPVINELFDQMYKMTASWSKAI